MTKIRDLLPSEKGGHNYKKIRDSKDDCIFGCGAWMGGDRSGAPKGIDPFGICPNNPINKEGENEMKVLGAKSLIGKKLDGFTIQEFIQVYKTDIDGRNVKNIGYFKDERIVAAYVEKLVDSPLYETNKVLLLTDGKIAFAIGDEAKLMDDEKAKFEVLEVIKTKLSPAEQKLLDL